MSVYNINLNEDFFGRFASLLIDRHKTSLPNLSNILVITPSYNISRAFQKACSKNGIILPKIIALAQFDEEFLFIERGGEFTGYLERREISDLKQRFLLFKIVQDALPSLSESSIFSYIDHFLEIENLIISGGANIQDALVKHEERLFNMAAKTAQSLENFFQIHKNWSILKSESQITTRQEKNAFYLNHFSETPLKYDAIYIIGAHGTNALQEKIMRGILNHENGHVVVSGLELTGEKKWVRDIYGT